MPHFGPGLAVDPTTHSPVKNVRIQVYDPLSEAYLTPLSPVYTNHLGQFEQFEIAEDLGAVLITAGPYAVMWSSVEVLTGAAEAVAELERLTVSHIAISPDGVPYYAPGTGTLRIHIAADGTPFYNPEEH